MPHEARQEEKKTKKKKKKRKNWKKREQKISAPIKLLPSRHSFPYKMILMDDVAQLGSMCFKIYAQRVPRDGDGSKDDDDDDDDAG